jgi:uncharacterized phage protein gp47/JayE
MSFGLTTTGFNRKTVQDITDEIERDERALISPNLDTQPETPIGEFNGIFSAKAAEIWELLEAINNNQDPRIATGFGLDGTSAITGTTRDPAEKGTVTLRLTLNAGVTVTTGSIAAVAGDEENQWVTLADATNPGAVPADIDVEAEASETGEIAANAGTITVIVTPVAGWTAVTNPLDAEPGTEIDTDTQLRVRRNQELQRAGTSPVNAIRADLLQVEDVENVTVLDNPTGLVDANNIPPHSIEAIVLGGSDQDVADALFDAAAGGAGLFGSTVVAVTDQQGIVHNVPFTRPEVITVWLDIEVDVDTDYPVDGDELIKAAIVAFGESTYGQGDDVILSALNVPILSITGTVDVTQVLVGPASPPLSAVNLVIAPRQLADFETTRITVTSTVI